MHVVSFLFFFFIYFQFIFHDGIEVRQEAVQQALAALKNRPKPSLPMPSKRSSVLNRSPDRNREDTGKKHLKKIIRLLVFHHRTLTQ